MSDKYYKVIKDMPAMQKGGIFVKKEGSSEYSPLNDLHVQPCLENRGNWTELSAVVENSPEFFTRVYPVNLLTKIVYKSKEEAREIFSKEHTA